MENKTRINKDMHVLDMIYAMSEGNPGSINVLMKLLSSPCGLLKTLTLDSHQIYGSKIWMLYKDCCKEDMNRFTLNLRLFQFGAFTQDQIDKNFAQVVARPFIDDSIALPEDIYDVKTDSIKDGQAFQEYVKAQSEAFKKKDEPEAE